MSEINLPSKVIVLGVGSAGCRIVAELQSLLTGSGVCTVLIDTDEKALRNYPEFTKLAIGGDWTDRQGCGGDAVRGEKATGASAAEIGKLINGSEMLIVVSPLGGGTGSGATPIIVAMAREMKILTLCFVTRPFSFEGNTKSNNADKAYAKLLKIAEAVICIDNDILFKNLSGNISQDFNAADRALAQCINGVTEMIFSDGLIKIDFTHIKQVLRQKDADCHVGIGQGFGEDRISLAIDSLMNSPTLGGEENLKQSDAVIVNLFAGQDLSMEMINDSMQRIRELFTEKTFVNIGVSTRSVKENFLQITVLTIKNRLKVNSEREDGFSKSLRSQKKAPLKKREETVYNIQGELPLQDMNSGVFENLSPTFYNGQNLDIPTYMRLGLVLDKGI